MSQKIWKELMEQPKWRKNATKLLAAKGDAARTMQLQLAVELKRTIHREKKTKKR